MQSCMGFLYADPGLSNLKIVCPVAVSQKNESLVPLTFLFIPLYNFAPLHFRQLYDAERIGEMIN